MILWKRHASHARLVSLASIALLSACATPPPPQFPTVQEAPQVYRIGAGDQLSIFVRNNPELSVSIPVRPDGRISIPLVKSMQAAGQTPTQLATDLENALMEYIRNPHVTVMVTGFVGTFENRIRIVGEASRPQALPYREGITLLDVMIAVGGLTEFAAGNSATLVRVVDGRSITYSIHLADLLDGDVQVNVPVLPGDVIVIPRALF